MKSEDAKRAVAEIKAHMPTFNQRMRNTNAPGLSEHQRATIHVFLDDFAQYCWAVEFEAERDRAGAL